MARPPSIRFRATDRAAVPVSLPMSCKIVGKKMKIDGNQINLDKFKGKPVLLVNTASRCGFTKQYANLSNLHREYLDKNLVIIGTPSNSFRQELADEEDVKEFCLVNYDTKFIISEIIDVDGDDAHPIYSWMTSTYNETPKWNFY